jgi:hypothetical protein
VSDDQSDWDSDRAGLDFSQFHDLMHRPFSAACRAKPGGPRRHLTLWWTYRAEPAIQRHTWCRVGVHRWGVVEEYRARRPIRSTVACTCCAQESKRHTRRRR